MKAKRQSTMTVVHLWDDVLSENFHLLVPCGRADLNAFAKKRWGVELEGGEFSGHCVHLVNERRNTSRIVIALAGPWKGDAYDLGTLAHECVHAALYALEPRGVKVRGDEQEMLSYLTGSLLRRFVEALRRERQRVVKSGKQKKKHVRKSLKMKRDRSRRLA